MTTRERLQDELDRLERAIDDVTERQALLQRLTGVDRDEVAAELPPDPEPHSTADEVGDDDATLLRGPDIRTTALQVALAMPSRPDALHYRDWYEALVGAGYRVAGKNPLAVFLTQLNRSPVVVKSTQSGVYEIDRAAPRRLRAKLAALQRELRDVAADSTSDREPLRQRRQELTVEIGRLERALEEAEAVLDNSSQLAA